MDFEYFDQIWQNEETAKKNSMGNVEMWNSRAEDFNRHGKDERREKISKILLDKQMIHKDSTVLDIGCGPGKFSVDFAQVAKHVVGLDVSPRMLEFAKENLAAKGSGSVEFIEMDWQNADIEAMGWKKKFSLVTGIMSPAFMTRENLEKMIEASNGYGFICHFVERRNYIDEILNKEVVRDKHVDDFGNRSLYCSLNLLWLYKLNPELTYFDTKKEIMRSAEELAGNFIEKYETKKIMTEEEKKEVRKILNDMAVDGNVKETTTAKVACISWKNF